ncbi:uncharacterized protein LOC117343846 [Pecten maximus]|uniref:uncharacterized protein LOC117343846 n=1 Tax=Pecten maximus TaxID=6579 RepID=UPI001458042A|nr:uncharacterized protein LOC117343846 [Pecten maximus]
MLFGRFGIRMTWKQVVTPWFVGILFLVCVPYLHIGIFHLKLWVPDKGPVDRENCRCTCWDTVFKGTYQNQDVIKYKHIYFNATSQTFIIWVITVCHMIAAYEALKFLWVTLTSRESRLSMMCLFLMDVYPIYYSWWNYLNYLNDDFYDQFIHQFFFTVTEFVSTCLILQLCSRTHQIHKLKILTIISISSVHLLIGGVDQFFVQMFLGEGRMHQKLRNFGFMLPDFLHIFLPLYVYNRSRFDINSDNYKQPFFTKADAVYSLIAICGGFVLGKVILS